jgi:hypothetical protein
MTVSDSGTPMIMGGDGFGCGGGFIWAFLIFALLMGNGGFGGFGGNNGNSNAIQADVNRGFDNQNLQAQTRDILTAVNNGTAQSVAASNQVFHDLSNNLSDKYSELARDVAGVNASIAQAIANQNECCCSQKMLIAETGAGINANIAQNRFDAAMNTAAINATTTAQTQKILDAISQNKIEALQGKVNQLELQNALSGVVRFPNSYTYNAGSGPFCNCGCGYPVYAM